MSDRHSRRWSQITIGMAVFAVMGAACGSASELQENTMNKAVETTSERHDFERFSGFPIPADAVVLGFTEEHGIDRYAGVIFEIPADQVDSMLATANFAGTLGDGFAPSNVVSIEGVELPNTDQVSSGQDRHTNDDELIVTRDVGVYVDGERATVSVAVFTT